MKGNFYFLIAVKVKMMTDIRYTKNEIIAF